MPEQSQGKNQSQGKPSEAPRSGDPEGVRGLTEHWREALDQHTTPAQRSLMTTWLSFGATFGAVRFITHGIRGGWLPLGNVAAGGKHLHHYNLGIATLAAVGLIAVRGDTDYVGHPGVGTAYGAGSALIADEFALLLDLKDVYWAEEGRLSVDVSFGILSALGAYLTAVPFWHEVTKVTARHALTRFPRRG